MSSAFLDEARNVQVWLPPGYGADPHRRYPVIYMPDGENLFDPRIASWGVDWGIDEAIAKGSAAGRIDPAIVVSAWSTSRRGDEYSPWADAPRYARFLIEELMPRIDAEFRTLTGPANTFAMGSSAGGLLSYYLVKEHGGVFGACGCLSTHFPLSAAMLAGWKGEDPAVADETPFILGDIRGGATVPRNSRFFFDYGTGGPDASYGPTHLAVREWLVDQGRVEGKDFIVREYPGADHNESAWRARVGDQLEWLLRSE
ncbi:MAG: esterase family protein [Gammaproteobacteria bacterium]|nr:esterase family protein [Gammaproteobacteria bacterium]MDH4313781.1 esterase family protein [Gammaproteobacteria bacterium]MDH5214799.1 esterase family protein [Gammaproteobacteria bacterium]MDH5500361.1 esterase family protein [Gammaproteobacteria bacterium]